MPIKFTKMHGLGNDFIIIDTRKQNIQLTKSLIRTLCDRHYGIGCDQLLLINQTKHVDHNHFDYQIFNSDGSEAEQCGNGARCIATYLCENQKTALKNIVLHTKNRQIEIIQGINNILNVNMGIPEFKNINSTLDYCYISMGNPHAVMVVQDINLALVDEIGKKFNHKHPDFPDGVNVGFVQIHDRCTISLRVYERGVGETLACGTGACAAVAAGISLNLLDIIVTVHLKGGDLVIRWPDKTDCLWMTGPAVRVFDGVI